MLQAWGWDKPNPFASFAAELLSDPLNIVGGGLLAKGLKGAKAAKAANAESQALRAMGAMPEEIAKLTKVVDEAGNPLKMYHGTPQHGLSVRDLDPAMAGKNTGNKGFLGEGVYFSENEPYATLYANNTGETLEAFIDARNPYITPHKNTARLAEELEVMPSWWDYGSQFSTAANDRLLDEVPPVIASTLKRRGYDAAWSPSGMRFGMVDPGEFAAFDPSQIYAPYIAKALQDVPSLAPQLLALLGYNTAAAPARTNPFAM